MSAYIKKIKVTTGVYWVEIPEVDLFILCGAPADSVKHLKKKGLINVTDKNGVVFETGPNAILLSDVLVQNGSFANLTEFPVLQMLYLQGLIIPNHPNNSGKKPLLIGNEQQIKSQIAYIFRGNYGLVSKEEMMMAGVSQADAEEMMRIKLKFAFGRITSPENLLQTAVIEDNTTTTINGVDVVRTSPNVYEFQYKGESVIVNLNLQPDERYEAPYQLDYHFIKREYFAVIHSGEGDGWDTNRPCMASILMYQGKIYLIDAGPNIMATLNYLGISVNEIEGIFQTHIHDDHFSGLSTLVRSDHRFKFYATKLVRHSVMKKLCALMSISEDLFSNFFDVHDLVFDEWTDVEGLQVKPIYSPHPVDNNVFFFRVKWLDEYKVYAHLADTTSFEVLDKMYATSTEQAGISAQWLAKTKESYLEKVNLKKIDVGGGMIHGDSEDFREDKTDKIVLAHTNKPLTMKQREVGSSASFGMTDVFIPATHDYLRDYARTFLDFYFPTAPRHEINYLLNHPIISINAGSILFKKGQKGEYVYLLLTGSVEFTDSHFGKPNVFSAGSLIGFYAGYLGQTIPETYWAASNINLLQMPINSYNEFVSRNNLYEELRQLEQNILFLSSTWLFGKVVSFPILSKVAKQMTIFEIQNSELILQKDTDGLYILLSGDVSIKGKKYTEQLRTGDFFCNDDILPDPKSNYTIVANSPAKFVKIPSYLATEIPVVYWKILEIYERRK
jgi:hemerythrin